MAGPLTTGDGAMAHRADRLSRRGGESGPDVDGIARRRELALQPEGSEVTEAGGEGRRAVARSGPALRPDLAGGAYADNAEGLLDLRWTPDEAGCLNPDPRRVWRELLAAGPDAVAETARAYALDDPYGARRATPVLTAYFGRPIGTGNVTGGAGVASLLRDLLILAEGGPVLLGRHGFADVPGWARGSGSPVIFYDEDATCRSWTDELLRCRPALMVVERPSVTGRVRSASALVSVLGVAKRLKTVVVTDESYANYLRPESSVVALTDQHDNLVVLRGLSKGYCQGGLRVGFALSSPALAQRVRAAVPTLQVSELALEVALRILAMPDPLVALRRRIATTKRPTVRRLRAFGVMATSGHPALPWVTTPDDGTIRQRLIDHGMLAKQVPTMGAPASDLLKIAVPLSEERVHRLNAALGAAGG